MKKYTTTSRWYNVFSLLLCLALGVMSVNAQSTTSTTGDWNTAGTWGGTLPAAGNTVTVNKAITVNSTVTNTVGAITIASGGSITFGASGVLNAANVIIQSGGTLSMSSGGTLNVSGNVTVQYGGTCNWTPPTVNSIVQVQAWSGGGGGAGNSSSSNLYSGGGGAGGNYVTYNPTVSSGTTYTVTAGAGGSGGGTSATGVANTSTMALPGGTSSFGSLVSITGGAPGFGGTAAAKAGWGGINNGRVIACEVTTAGATQGSLTYTVGTLYSNITSSTSLTVGQQISIGTTTTSGNLYTVVTAGTAGAAPSGTSTTPFSTTGGTAQYVYAGTSAIVSASLTGSSPSISVSYFSVTTPGSGYNSNPTLTVTSSSSMTTTPQGTCYANPVTVVPTTATYYLGGQGGDGSYIASSASNESGSGGSSASSTGAGVQGSIPWVPSMAYFSTNSTSASISYVTNGGNLYQCTTAGTSASSGGPTGTGTGITDGTAKWNYISAAPTTPTGAGAGGAAVTTSATVGNAGAVPGGGGSGSTGTSKAGGAGGAGQVIFSYTNIVTSGTLAALSTIQGTASSSTSFNVSATNALSGITVTAPTGFLVSLSSGSGYASSVTVGSAGTISSTPVYIELAASTTAGSYGTGGTGTTTIGLTATGYSGTLAMPASSVLGNNPSALSIQYISDNTQQLSWTAPAGSYDGMLVFAKAASGTYSPSGAGSAYTGANANITSATSYGGYYLVYAGTNTSVEVTGLNPGTSYYYQVYSYSGSSFSTSAITNGATLSAPAPVTGLTATPAGSGGVSLSWTNPTAGTTTSLYYSDVMVLAYPTSATPPSTPTGSYSTYTSGTYPYTTGTANNGGYVVYYGTGNSATVSGFTDFSSYYFVAYVVHNSSWSTSATTSSVTALPYAAGDYVSVATGAYNATSTWNTWSGSALVSATSTPSSTSNVWIVGGYTVSVSTTTEPTNAPPVTSTANSSATASANNLYVINGTLMGTNETSITAIKNPLVIFGTTVDVGTNGTVGSTGTGNSSNGLEFFIANAAKIDNYPSHSSTPATGGINLNKLLLYGTSSSVEIATSMGLHYHGSSGAGQAVALGLDNSSTSTTSINGTITIDAGATVTMDQECVVSPYTGANDNIYACNFSLIINGTLTFLPGWVTGNSNAYTGYNYNGYLSLGNGTANTGSAGTGSYLHIGSSGTLNVPEFYPNGTNFAASGSIVVGAPGNGQLAGIVIDAGGVLNVGSSTSSTYIADFRTVGQTVTGAGSFNFNPNSVSGAKMLIGDPTGMGVIKTTGSNSFDGTFSTYNYTIPTSWQPSSAYILGQQVTYGGNTYTVTAAGTSTTTPPSGTGTTVAGATFVYLSGAAQHTGTALPSPVYGLSISNTSGITLDAACTVTTNYTQTSTILSAASSSAVLTLGTSSNPITLTGASSTNYVAGPLQLYSAPNTTAQSLVFPIASGTASSSDYVPVTLNFTQGAATSTAYKVIPVLGTSGTSVHTNGITGGGVSTTRYYTVSSSGNTISGGSIQLNYDSHDEDGNVSTGDASIIEVAQSANSTGSWTGLGGTASADGTGNITSSVFSTFGDFAIANTIISVTPPTLVAAGSANASTNYTITFTDNSAWRAAIYSVSYNGTNLTSGTDYTISGGQLTIKSGSTTANSVVHTAGNIAIIVKATGYKAADVSQTVTYGAAAKLAITTQPVPSSTSDGVVFTTAPVVEVQDAYGNPVSSSSASINAAVGTGSNSSFSLGGDITSVASSGVATFSTLTAINHNTTSVSGTITFSSAGLTSVTTSSFTIAQPTTYWWIGGASNANGAWASGVNTYGYWATSKGGSAVASFTTNSTDVYIIDGTNIGSGATTNAAVTLKYSNSPTIGQFIVQNGAQVTMTTTTSNLTINIAGDNGANGHVTGVNGNGDLFIDGSSSLTTYSSGSSVWNMMAGSNLNISAYATPNAAGYNLGLQEGFMDFGSGATATISGIVNVGVTTSNTSNCLISTTANAIQFLNGSTCIIHGNSSGYPFGQYGVTYGSGGSVSENTSITGQYTPIANGVIFQSGSTINYESGLDIFGGSSTNPVAQLQSGSNFVVVSGATGYPKIDGYTFSNITFSNASTTLATGTNGFTCNNLSVTQGIVTIPESGTINVKGNISVATSSTLKFTGTSTTTLNLNGSSTQTINTYLAKFTVPSNLNVVVNNASGVTLNSSDTITGNLTLTNGTLTVGPSDTLTFASITYGSTGSLAITSSPIASASSLIYTGTGTFTLPSSFTRLTYLKNANASGTLNVNQGLYLYGALSNAGTLNIASGDSIFVGNGNNSGSIQSPLSNSGHITGSGCVVINSGLFAQINGSGGYINNLYLNPTASHNIQIPSGSSQNITGMLSIGSLGTLDVSSGGKLTLKSTSISSSAILGNVSGAITSTSTGITVERYIPAGYRAYRDLGAAGVYASTNTLFNSWQENGSYSNNGYGIFITGATTLSGSTYSSNHLDATTGLDYSLNSYPSANMWNNATQSWSAISNTNTTALNPYQSYRVLVRGDRSFDLYTTPIINYPAGLRMVDATTLRDTGLLIYGDVTYSTTGVTNSVTGSAFETSSYGLSTAASGYSYISNPYDCPIDFHNIYSNNRITNMIDGYWYLDPTKGATGAYVAYNAVANVTNTGYSNGNFIQAGQGFLVGNFGVSGSNLPSLKITEADKSTVASSKTSVFGEEVATSKLFVGLLKESTRVDGVAVVFSNKFSNGIGLEDSRKIASGSDNLSILEGNDNLSIDGRLPATSKDVLSLRIGQPSTTSYLLRIDASGYINEGYSPFLYDAYKNTRSSIEGVDSFSITLDTAISASYANRFSIIFTPSALAVNSIVASATLSNKVATITWNTVGEKGESYYSVEKSTDGKNFTAIGQQAAKNTATASYTATDNSVVEGNNYYRIKAVSETGSVNYSNVAKVQLTVNSNQFTIYPNPLVGKTLNVQVANVSAGKYVVSIYNVLGEKVNEQTISHSGGSATHAITINNTLAGGVYSLVIRESGSNQIIHQSNLSVQP